MTTFIQYDRLRNQAIANIALGVTYSSPLSPYVGCHKRDTLSTKEIFDLVDSHKSRDFYDACFEDIISRHYDGGTDISEDEEEMLTDKFWFDHVYPEQEEKLALGQVWVKVFKKGEDGLLTGFSIYLANQFRYTTDDATRKIASLTIQSSRALRLHEDKMNISTIGLSADELAKSLKTIDKSFRAYQSLMNEMALFVLIETTGLSPVYCRYKVNKSKSVVVHTADYDILTDDIMERLAEVNGTTVKQKNIYKSDTSDQVFYLRSRGVSKKIAEAMANLHGMSLHYDITKMFAQLN